MTTIVLYQFMSIVANYPGKYAVSLVPDERLLCIGYLKLTPNRKITKNINLPYYPAQCIAQGVMESVVSVRFCITFSGWGLVARRAPRFAAYSTIVACRCLQMRPLVSSSRRQILWRFRYWSAAIFLDIFPRAIAQEADWGIILY